jgi:hypothetical protein
VKLHWDAVGKDGTVFAVGLSFLVLAADGRIERDYTFIVAQATPNSSRGREWR